MKKELEQFKPRYLKLPEADYERSKWATTHEHKLSDSLTVMMEDDDPYEFASIYKDGVLVLQEYCICGPQEDYVKHLRGDTELLEFICANL